MSNLTLQQITPHVYWMNPDDPDRPSLAAVVGTTKTVMLDAGASVAHTQIFLDALKAEGVRLPDYVVLTHWHWDHIFGLPALNMPIMAHQLTVQEMYRLKGYDWSDAALDERLKTGEEIEMCAQDIKLELPEPRQVDIMIPDIVFQNSLALNLGDMTCHVQHVGGDHAEDSCVIHVVEDQFLFLGDALYDAIYTPVRHLTKAKMLPLLAKILSFKAQYFVQGHDPEVRTRDYIETLAEQMRYASQLIDQFQGDKVQALALAKQDGRLDEDMEDFIEVFAAGFAMA